MSLLPESYDIPHQVDIGNVFDAIGTVRIYIFDRGVIYSAYMLYWWHSNNHESFNMHSSI